MRLWLDQAKSPAPLVTLTLPEKSAHSQEPEKKHRRSPPCRDAASSLAVGDPNRSTLRRHP
jgi:hypothetical protein